MAPISSSAQIAGYAYFLPPPEVNNNNNQTGPGTAYGEGAEGAEEGHVVMVNGTLVRLLLKTPFRDSQLNELLYVIIVIVFYATALMTLIITQIKRQRREGGDVDYYDEYLQRNQEVKRTCQTATTLVRKSDGRPPAASSSSTNGGGGASADKESAGGHLLELPARARDPPPTRLPLLLQPRDRPSAWGPGALVCAAATAAATSRDSPMLESIPDVGT
ncbi:uncharacterized protein LOC143280278 [Babylonia areolata]|uniref:uncharacterized protein LOC143280278 n=1 Tax=Babylonia areolata TaxID=304850 RepID=UPI003FCFB04E